MGKKIRKLVYAEILRSYEEVSKSFNYYYEIKNIE